APWVGWHQLAYVTLLSQLQPLLPAEVEAWRRDVQERAPALALADLLEAGSEDLYLHWPATAEHPVSVYACARREDLEADRPRLNDGATRGLRLLACLEDHDRAGGEQDADDGLRD